MNQKNQPAHPEKMLTRLREKIESIVGGKGVSEAPSGSPPDPLLLKSVFEGLQDGLSVHDRDYNILLVNPVIETLFSHKMPLVGKKCYSAYFGYPGPCPGCQCKKALETGAIQSGLTELNLPSSGTLWFETRAYPMRDEAQNVTGVLIQHHNIGDRKKLEISLAQAELYLDLLSHDINNLNQIALNNLEMIKAELLDSVQKNRISSSIDILTSIAGLIRNVRSLQMVEKGDLPLEPVDVSDVLARVVERYSQIPGKTVVIHFHPLPGSMVLANGLLSDVFANLLHNAIRHSSSDVVEISLAVALLKQGEKWFYRITIDDNGPGIPDELKPQLFEKAASLEKKSRGRGLGLYLVKTLVDRYAGSVWVEDRVHGDYTKGARFVVLLPALD